MTPESGQGLDPGPGSGVHPGPGGEPARSAPRGAGRRVVVAGLAGSALMIAAFTLVARVAGFGRTLVFSGSVGGGCAGTAYATANQLPNVLFEVVAGGALAGAVVPVVAGRLAAGSRAEADRIASALLTWTVLALMPAALLLALAAGPLTRLLLGDGASPTLCDWTADDGARMLVIFSPQVVLYGIGIVLAGVLQAHSRFAWPAIAPLLSSITVIVAYLAFARLAGGAQQDAGWRPDDAELLVLAGGTTLGVAALSLPLFIPVLRTGTRLRPVLRFPPGAATAVRGLALAGLGALLAQQAVVLATLALAGRVGGTGALNVVQYAQAVYLLPYAVLAVPLATAAFPRLSAHAARGEQDAYAATTATMTRAVVVVSVLGAAVLIAAAAPVQALFERLDRVGGTAFTSLGDALVAFAPGLVGWALVAHIGRALYAAGRGREAAVATVAGWSVALVASVALVLGMEAAGTPGSRAAAVGLAAGNTVGMTVAGILLLVSVRKVGGPAALSGVARAGTAALAGAVVAAVLGTVTAEALLDAGPLGEGVPAAVIAGAAAAAVATAAVVAAVALLDRSDLSALVHRLSRRRSP